MTSKRGRHNRRRARRIMDAAAALREMQWSPGEMKRMVARIKRLPPLPINRLPPFVKP